MAAKMLVIFPTKPEKLPNEFFIDSEAQETDSFMEDMLDLNRLISDEALSSAVITIQILFSAILRRFRF